MATLVDEARADAANPGVGKDPRAAVDKAMSLLQAFGADGWSGLGVSELARRADLSKSTAFRVLGLLERNGAVERVGSDFRLGGQLSDIGSVVDAPANRRISDRVTPFLLDLYAATRQTVHLAVLHGTDVVYLHKLQGHSTIRCPSRIGSRAPAFATAGGKVLLAQDAAALDRTVAGGLRPRTTRTITDPRLLRAELDRVRRSGVAISGQEAVPGLVCLAAPVIAGPGRPAAAAISVSGDAGSFDPAAHEAILRRVARAAGRALTAQPVRAAG